MNNSRSIVAVLIALLLSTPPARSEVTPAKVLGDNMVLQRGMSVPIWGTAAPDEQINVSFAAQQKSTKADANGNWRVSLDALTASDTPTEMTIRGSNTITLKNLLVGEVWICGGQSNMEFPMRGGQGMRPRRMKRVRSSHRKRRQSPSASTTSGPANISSQ